MAGKKTQQASDGAEVAVKAAVARRDALSVQLAEAELEVVTLTAAAKAAGYQLPLAKRQRRHGPLLRWQTETSLWDLATWNEKDKEEQERRAVRIDDSASQLQPRTGVMAASSTGAAGSLALFRAGRAAARRTSCIY
jgi:hypothetical protein